MIGTLLVFDLKGKMACWKKFYSNSSSFTYELPTRTHLIGILASILELPRDSYYEKLDTSNCKLSIKPCTLLKRQFHCMNYFKKPNKREYTQVRLEVLQPHHIQDELIAYRVYVWLKDDILFAELIDRIKEQNWGYGIYLGQRQFRGNAEFVALSETVTESFNATKEICSITNINNLESGEKSLSDLSDINIERMPLGFVFAEKDTEGNIDEDKLNSNFLNRELESIGRIVYPKRPGSRVTSSTPFKYSVTLSYNQITENIAFYENEIAVPHTTG